MRINVVGAGSLGLLIAGKLAFAGIDVTVTTRSTEQRDEMRRQGITISGLTEGTAKNVHAKALEDACDASEPDRFDWIFLAVKATHLADSTWLERAAQDWGERPRWLLFQNGMGHIEKLKQFVPEDRLNAAVTTFGARRENATRVVHTGTGELWLGAVDAKDPKAAHNLAKVMNEGLIRAGFNAKLTEDITGRLWEKLIVNSVINPLTAVLRLRNGELPAAPERLRLMRSVYEEALAVAARSGRTPSDDLWEQILLVCSHTARNHSSMLQDVLAGRPTEIAAITGYLLHKAEEFGISLPVNQTLHDLVKGLEPNESAGN